MTFVSAWSILSVDFRGLGNPRICVEWWFSGQTFINHPSIHTHPSAGRVPLPSLGHGQLHWGLSPRVGVTVGVSKQRTGGEGVPYILEPGNP
jgi:hypothetical protein